MMDDLYDAIDLLKGSLATDGYESSLVEEVAKEYDLNPALLVRKFSEATGVEPSQWRPPVDTLTLSRELAKKTAFELTKIFLAPLPGYDFTFSTGKSGESTKTVDLYPITDVERGTLFCLDKEEYAFIGRNSHTNNLSAVNVRRNRSEVFEPEDWNTFIENIRRNTIAGPNEY